MVGALQSRIHDVELRAEIQKADLIWGVCPRTGQKTGPYYGIAKLKRIVRRNTGDNLYVVKVDVDPGTDDIEVLYAMVQHIKGACCYEAFVSED